MKFFVTGGSGYIGRNFISYALSQSPSLQIVALSRSDAADETILRAAEQADNGRGRIKILRGNVHSEAVLKEGIEEADVVVHLAAKVGPWGIYSEFEDTNFHGTRILLSVISSLPETEPKPRLVYISSFTAKMSLHYPLDKLPDWAPYVKAKCLTEEMVHSSSLEDVAILRLGWCWAKDDNVLLPQMHGLCHNPLWKVTPASYPLSTLHITNACEAILCASTVGEIRSRIYEIKDRESNVGMEEFVEFYVGSAHNLDRVPKPFRNFRLPKWLVLNALALAETIPFLGYGTKWVYQGMARACLVCVYEDLRLDESKAVEEIGYVGKVSRQHGTAALREQSRQQLA